MGILCPTATIRISRWVFVSMAHPVFLDGFLLFRPRFLYKWSRANFVVWIMGSCSKERVLRSDGGVRTASRSTTWARSPTSSTGMTSTRPMPAGRPLSTSLKSPSRISCTSSSSQFACICLPVTMLTVRFSITGFSRVCYSVLGLSFFFRRTTARTFPRQQQAWIRSGHDLHGWQLLMSWLHGNQLVWMFWFLKNRKLKPGWPPISLCSLGFAWWLVLIFYERIVLLTGWYLVHLKCQNNV